MSKLKIDGEKLREQIQIKYNTQTAFANELNVTNASVSRWINEKTVPSRTIYRICDALNIKKEYLVKEDSNE